MIADHNRQLVRDRDRDRYLATLLAPRERRPHLFALHAFALELADVAERVTEPLAGEVRLQWWRDTLGTMRHGAASGHPVADALARAIEAGRLPPAALQAMVDAHDFDLYGELFATSDELMAYLGATFGATVQLACLILAGGDDPRSGTAAGHAGVALGLTWIMTNLGRHAARGRLYLPGEMLAKHGVDPAAILRGEGGDGLRAMLGEQCAAARQRIAALAGILPGLDARLRPAFAPVAACAATLRQLERAPDPLRVALAPQPLRRQWRIWRCVATGKV